MAYGDMVKLGGVRTLSSSNVTATIAANGSVTKTFDFTNDMDASEEIISVHVTGTGTEVVIPRLWFKKTRTTATVSFRNISASQVTSSLQVQVIVATI